MNRIFILKAPFTAHEGIFTFPTGWSIRLCTTLLRFAFYIRRLYCEETFVLMSTKDRVQPDEPPCIRRQISRTKTVVSHQILIAS